MAYDKESYDRGYSLGKEHGYFDGRQQGWARGFWTGLTVATLTVVAVFIITSLLK